MSNKNRNAAAAVVAAPPDAIIQGDGTGTALPPVSQESRVAPAANEQAAAPAEANQGEAPEAPAAESTSKAPAWKIGDVVEIVSVYGSFQHLHTGDVFGAAPVSAEIDAFLSLQLDAGKLAIVPSAT